MLLPTRCPVCQAVGEAPCARCRSLLRRAPALPPPPGIAVLWALLAYVDEGRELVARLKYRNARSSLRWLAAAMAMLVDRSLVDVVTWAPTTPARRRQRGFDHAELLARSLARELRLPARPVLVRVPGPAQTGLDAPGRARGPRFRPVHSFAVGRAPPRVLVVDDVVTTGATLRSAARTLRAAGAVDVLGAVAARTP